MKKISTQKICILGLFAALAVIFAMLTTYRPIPLMKFSLKFIPVFFAGFIYGPFWAGIISAIGDFINASITTGVNPLITAVELLCGVVFGLCFLKAKNNGFYYIRAVICALLQLAIALFIMTPILMTMGIGQSPNFTVAILTRLPEKLIMFIIQLAFMCIMKHSIFKIQKLFTKDNAK